MSRTLLITFGIGLVVVAIAVWGIVRIGRGGHVELPGTILKVRTAPLDEQSAAAVIDFRVTNPSDYPFQVRGVTVVLESQSGAQIEGATASETDAQQLMAGVPLLGDKYNPSLMVRERVPARTTLDRMIAARFEVPDSQLQARKRFLLRIEEVDGVVQELSEK
ncbi:MAG: hypothetical protein ABSE35_23020 [Bryobacteraceae bacterium]|jgi:hypothetical protein